MGLRCCPQRFGIMPNTWIIQVPCDSSEVKMKRYQKTEMDWNCYLGLKTNVPVTDWHKPEEAHIHTIDMIKATDKWRCASKGFASVQPQKGKTFTTFCQRGSRKRKRNCFALTAAMIGLQLKTRMIFMVLTELSFGWITARIFATWPLILSRRY